MSKPEIFSVQPQVVAPGRGHQHGVVTEGRYIVTGDVVTLTDRDGRPVRDSDGRQYTAKLGSDHHKQVAARLTKKMWLAVKDKSRVDGFEGSLKHRYPRLGWM